MPTNPTNGGGRRPARDQFVLNPLVIALTVVQVDNPTPIILSREKSVIRGIRGSVVLSSCTRFLSDVGIPYVGAAARKSEGNDPSRSRHGCVSRPRVVGCV